MKKNNKILTIKYNGSVFPVIELIDTKREVVIRFIHTTHHWTLHKAKIISDTGKYLLIKNGHEELKILKNSNPDQIIFTSYDEDKARSTWDSCRVKIAEKCGYKNPKRHGKYIIHELLKTTNGERLYDLGGRTVNLIQKNGDNKYLKNNTFNIGKSFVIKPMLEGFLTTENSRSNNNYLFVECSLGFLYFIISERPTCLN